MKIYLLIPLALIISGCQPPTQKITPVATPKPIPTVRPTNTPIPTPTMTPRQKRNARRAERRRIAKERREMAEYEAEQRENQRKFELQQLEEKEEKERYAREYAVLDGKVDKSEYNRIRMGMDISDVLDIIGSGKEVSTNSIGGITTTMYAWENPDGSNMNAIFQDFKLVSKAQYGIL